MGEVPSIKQPDKPLIPPVEPPKPIQPHKPPDEKEPTIWPDAPKGDPGEYDENGRKRLPK